jgi:ATP-dependent Clp protease ATP-binding subunit ClpA
MKGAKLKFFSGPRNISPAHFDKFINRIDEVVMFHTLDEKCIKSIARIQLQHLQKTTGSDGVLAQIS